MKSAEQSSAQIIPLPKRAAMRAEEREFLPAALEIVETPASPLGRAVAGTVMLFLVIAVAWACFGQIDIIATAQGRIVPTGRVKVVQPLDAGVVTAIRARDGDKVTEGQVLIELDRTLTTAERDRVAHELVRIRLDVARLVALRAGLDADLMPVAFSPPGEATAHEVARTLAVMTAQAEQQKAKIASLDHQIAQKFAEGEEVAAVIAKLQTGMPLVEETADVRRKAMEIQYGNRIAHLEAQIRLNDQRHELMVQQRRAVEIAAARAALAAQREQARAEYVRGIVGDLAEAEQKAGQLTEDMTKTQRKMQDQVLRAPIDGTVQQLALHTIGGVVTPAQALMVIVPADSRIEIEAMILNRDIGFVEEGDAAEIKIDTFNFTKYGLLHGKVLSVSADAIARERPAGQSNADKVANISGARSSEPQGQELTYAARISLNQTRMQIERKVVDLTPGMAVTVEIRTGQRRIIEYLLSPLLRYKQESLRER